MDGYQKELLKENGRAFWEDCVTAVVKRGVGGSHVENAVTIADYLYAAWKLRFTPDDTDGQKGL